MLATRHQGTPTPSHLIRACAPLWPGGNPRGQNVGGLGACALGTPPSHGAGLRGARLNREEGAPWLSLLARPRGLFALIAGVLTCLLSARQVQQLPVGVSPFAVGKPAAKGRPEPPLPSRSALLLKGLMERFLTPAEKGPGPRATEEEEADAAQQGSPKEAARREAPPSPGVPWERIRAEGLSCDYATLYGRAQADEMFQQLEEEVEYFEGEFTKLHIFGKWHNIPRKQVTYGDAGLTYTYSGVTFSPKPWTPVLNRIRDRVQLLTGHTFNFVLINRYKDGHDHIGEHRDDERELVPRSPIASVSFGARRDFIFRHGASRGKNPSRRIAPVKLPLDHGSLLMMNFPTNHYWYHSLPIRKKVLAPRINLTFRKVRTL